MGVQLVLIGCTSVNFSILRILHFKNVALSSTLLQGAKSRKNLILKFTAVTTSNLTSLGAFAKIAESCYQLRQVRPSVYKHETTGLPLDGFS